MSAPTTECPVPANELFCNELADDRRKANWNDDGTLGTYMTLYSCLKRVKVNIEVSYFIYCRDLDPSDWATGWWLSTSQPQICHMVDDGCWKVSLQLETVVWGDANEIITGCMLDWIPTSTWTYYLPLERLQYAFSVKSSSSWHVFQFTLQLFMDGFCSIARFSPLGCLLEMEKHRKDTPNNEQLVSTWRGTFSSVPSHRRNAPFRPASNLADFRDIVVVGFPVEW